MACAEASRVNPSTCPCEKQRGRQVGDAEGMQSRLTSKQKSAFALFQVTQGLNFHHGGALDELAER
jgi:hypothetical protein